MIDLKHGLALLEQLPAQAATFLEDEALSHYLSNFALRFSPDVELPKSLPVGQPDFWLFLPFATVRDFPGCAPQRVRQLAIASVCMIVYNLLFDTVVDDPGKPDITTQVLAEAALAKLHEQLYALFPPLSPFWNYYRPLYHRFLSAMIEERTAHKGRPQPYTYADYIRLSQEKMTMVLLNPLGLAVLGDSLESIPVLLAAWHELNVAVVMLDDIKDWEEDYHEANFTYLLTQALNITSPDQPLPKDESALITQVVFSGVIESLYRQGARHLDLAATLAQEIGAEALVGLANERAIMFRKFGRQLFQRKLTAWRQSVTNLSHLIEKKEELP
jgi:hypothetical protein